MVSRRTHPPSPVTGKRIHADQAEGRGAVYAQVYRLVRRIPRGRVMTYGQVAALLEQRLSPRAVGWAMHGCPQGLPWQRVVNASGACSTDRIPDVPTGLQRSLLESEGVEFRPNGTLDLDRYRWVPRSTGTPRVSLTRKRKKTTTRK